MSKIDLQHRSRRLITLSCAIEIRRGRGRCRPICRYFYVAEHKSSEGAETAGHGFPAMADIMASNPEDGQLGKERAAEETAAIMAAMIEPMQEIKTARGAAAQTDKGIAAQRFRYCDSRGFEIRRGKPGRCLFCVRSCPS